jgi:glycosyltransferase involved in cell wall biosynthesis
MNNKKGRITKKRSSVSIITISQLKRFDCLLNLYELIKLQNYKNIIEWVIVEGSKNQEDGLTNSTNMKELIKTHEETKNSNEIIKNLKINYIEYTGIKLSDLRNLGNNTCSGEIIVCMDDDDYYPPERVSHSVESLENSPFMIAGCSDIYMYEYFMGKLYKFKGFHERHSTNNCMAFKKQYLRNHKHQDGLDMAEEKSFTNDFTEPMVQLNSKKCIIVSSHNYNTFNKRELCVGGSLGVNQSLHEVNDHPISSYIPPYIFKRIKDLFYKEEESPYDIVYMTGGLCNKWDPKDKSLGGSEQAVVNLSENWVKLGKRVAVYGEITSNRQDNVTHNGVEYMNWKLFEFNHKFKTVIIWRNYGLFSCLPFDVKATNLLWDIHDNFSDQDHSKGIYLKYRNKLTKVLLKSNFHKEEFEKHMGIKLNENQYLIIPNGIKVDEFSKNWDNVTRNPYRFCYVSYYVRGLEHILKGIWPIIKKMEPKAELHLYYGLEMFKDENLVNHYKQLIGSSMGVIDHGRQNTDFIVREKYLSSFQLYISNTNSEIDCISIRESLVTGCIPLISDFGVFKEREGIHFQLVEHPTVLNSIGEQIVKILKEQQTQMEVLRGVFKKSQTILSWGDIAKKWLEHFN